MGWPQPQSPIQTDNTTALGVANKTIIAKKNEVHGQVPLMAPLPGIPRKFRYYWGHGPSNLADYSTKAHPDIYHESQRLTHAC
eukprot:CCRYP_000541-RA/>CCRYP_000541-RA protein AED:0.28 eAED:0.28 QI:0/-1/0/1/-1/0/1/0/82